MAVEIISITTKVWVWARIKLMTPGSAVRHVSAVRYVTNCTARPGCRQLEFKILEHLPYIFLILLIDTFTENPQHNVAWRNKKYILEILRQ